MEPARPSAVREHRLAPWFAVAAVCLGAFMGQLDASIVTLAFPALQHDFGIGLGAAQWVSLAYLLVLVALLVPVGRWSDRAGRKLVYLYGFAVFTAASAGCGLAPTLWSLVILRVVQAFGAAMLQANSVALVATSVSPGRRRAALGIQAGAQAIGLALGPTLGGVVVSSLGWRWIFGINVPVGIVAIAAGWLLLPRTRDRGAATDLDRWGIMLLAAASTALLVALSSAAGLPLPATAIGGLAVIAVATTVLLIRWERRAPRPLLDPAVLASAGVGVGLGGALLAYLVLFGPLVLFPQVDDHAGVLATGLVLTALPAGFGLAAVAADRVLPATWSDRRRCLTGAFLATVAGALLTVPVPPAGTAVLLGVLGLGLGVYIPANNASIMSAVSARTAATVGGMLNMARSLGTAGGVTVVTVTLHVAASTGGGTHARTAAAMTALACAAILMGVAAWRSEPARALD